MRAKVDCLAAEQNDPSAAASVHAHRALALDHLRAGTVGLLVVGGLPGFGKSTVATGLADRIDAVVVSSDVVRKERAGLPPELVQLLADAVNDPDCARAVSAATAPLLGKLPADVGEADVAPLLVLPEDAN